MTQHGRQVAVGQCPYLVTSTPVFLTGLPVILDDGLVGGLPLPAFKAQLLELQLDLRQILLDVDGRLLGVVA